jgi:hypothetical protein
VSLLFVAGWSAYKKYLTKLHPCRTTFCINTQKSGLGTCILLVFLRGAVDWFSQDPIDGMRISYWIPWSHSHLVEAAQDPARLSDVRFKVGRWLATMTGSRLVRKNDAFESLVVCKGTRGPDHQTARLSMQCEVASRSHRWAKLCARFRTVGVTSIQ